MSFECKYSIAGEFVKKGNLVDYFKKKPDLNLSPITHPQWVKSIERERAISLYVLTRWENGKLFCRIKCPVNPLPIKGEFQITNFTGVKTLLESMGWEFIGTHMAWVFK